MSFTGRIRSAGRVSLPVLAIQECQRYPKYLPRAWRLPLESAHVRIHHAEPARPRHPRRSCLPPEVSPEQRAITATAADDIWAPEQMGKFLDHIATHRLGGCFAGRRHVSAADAGMSRGDQGPSRRDGL
jgi:hypothetical protein